MPEDLIGKRSRETESAAPPSAAPVTEAAARAAPGANTNARTEGGEPATGKDSPESSGTETSEALSDLLRGCERSTLYHKAREGALDSFHRIAMFFVVVSGSGAVLAMTRDSQYAPILALVPATLGALDLVFGFSRQARDHALLARQFMDLAADACAENSRLSTDELRARFYRLTAEEPPVYEAVESLCFNQVASAMDSPKRKEVPLFYRLCRHFMRFSSKQFAVVGSDSKPD